MSVMAYALLTLSAVSGFAVFLQERALKRKQPTKLTRLLPAVAEGERLQIGLLVLAEILLGLGVATEHGGELDQGRRRAGAGP